MNFSLHSGSRQGRGKFNFTLSGALATELETSGSDQIGFNAKSLQTSRSKAFTLIELLTVMAIIGVLTAITVPALSSIGKAASTNQTINEISFVLDRARAYAMANDTYVWVGFAQNDNTQKLTVGAVAGLTGQVSDLNSNTTYLPIDKLQTFNWVSLTAVNGLSGMASDGDEISTSQVGTFSQTGGSGTTTFTTLLQFDPQGAATIDKSPGSSHYIQIGLRPVRAGNVTDPNVAVLQVAALTGDVQIFRP
jgi:prepilin-type N-terminal cleavage/methylation domain-containing protein